MEQLKMTNERYQIQYDGVRYFVIIDTERESLIARLDTMLDAKAFLEMYTMLTEENEHIKNTIQDMITTERTQLGQSVLKQLMERIQ